MATGNETKYFFPVAVWRLQAGQLFQESEWERGREGESEGESERERERASWSIIPRYTHGGDRVREGIKQ